MNYSEIISLIFRLIYIVGALALLPFLVFFFVGIFKKKKFPETNKINSYRILVAARNEASVIKNFIDSVKQSNYPQDKIEIYVVAHNCADNTAEIAKSCAVHVYEFNNEKQQTKGYALRYLMQQIQVEQGINTCDGYFIFDADNIVSTDYFQKMNDAFEYYDGNAIVTSFRNSKNFGSSIISGQYGVYFASGCFSIFRARTVLNCTTRVTGTGYVVPSKFLRNGWNYVTLTEDWELSADQTLAQNKIYYCDDAVFYDEQPTSFKIMWKQRVRWSIGHLLVFTNSVKGLLKRLFHKETKHKMSTYDTILNCSPICLAIAFLAVIEVALLFLSPIFGITLKEAFIGNFAANTSYFRKIFFGSGFLFCLIRVCIIAYVVSLFYGITTFIEGAKRINGVNIFKKIVLCLLWPFFLALQFAIDIRSLFNKNYKWEKIPHEDTTTIETLNEANEKRA